MDKQRVWGGGELMIIKVAGHAQWTEQFTSDLRILGKWHRTMVTFSA